MRIYYGMAIDGERSRVIFATITGEMADGTKVYTEIKQTEGGAIVREDGSPVLLLDNQYTRHLKRGMQTFERL